VFCWNRVCLKMNPGICWGELDFGGFWGKNLFEMCDGFLWGKFLVVLDCFFENCLNSFLGKLMDCEFFLFFFFFFFFE